MSKNNKPNVKLGNYINKLRIKKGLSAKEAAEIIGTSTAYLNTLESGEIIRPRKKMLTRLSKALRPQDATRTEIYSVFLKLADYDQDQDPTKIREMEEEVAGIETKGENQLERQLLAMPWKTTAKWAENMVYHLEKTNRSIEQKMIRIENRNLSSRHNMNEYKIQKALNQILMKHLNRVKQLQENRR